MDLNNISNDYSCSLKGDVCNQNQWSKRNYTSNKRLFNA